MYGNMSVFFVHASKINIFHTFYVKWTNNNYTVQIFAIMEIFKLKKALGINIV